MVEHDRLAPPGVAKVARSIWNDECGFRFKGYEITDYFGVVEHHLARY